MLKWDGSNITDIISHSDIYESEYNKIKYWLIRHVNPDTNKLCEELVIVRTTKGSLPSLIDELKPLFGLQKMGTHWFKYKNTTKIIMPCQLTEKGYIKKFIPD
jgi:hypothetical protein